MILNPPPSLSTTLNASLSRLISFFTRTSSDFSAASKASCSTGCFFLLIGIKYDGKNLVAGEVEILDTADGRGEATEKFKILVVRNKLI